jgi:3-dehydroquinate synthetase
MDKKRVNNTMNFVLVDKIGKGVVYPIKLNQLKKFVSAYAQLSK